MLKEALDDSNTALQIDPNCHLTMLVKADLLQRLERIQESFEALNQVDESKVKKEIYLTTRAKILIQLNERDECLKDINLLIKIAPDSLEAYTLKAWVLTTYDE
jgi:tetratricopeptide (TPR) repeat protein